MEINHEYWLFYGTFHNLNLSRSLDIMKQWISFCLFLKLTSFLHDKVWTSSSYYIVLCLRRKKLILLSSSKQSWRSSQIFKILQSTGFSWKEILALYLWILFFFLQDHKIFFYLFPVHKWFLHQRGWEVVYIFLISVHSRVGK